MSMREEIKPLLFPGANQGQQAREVQSALFRMAAEGGLARDHGGTQGALGGVVRRVYLGFTQPQQQLIEIFENPLGDALTVGIGPGFLREVLQALAHFLRQGLTGLRIQRDLFQGQAHFQEELVQLLVELETFGLRWRAAFQPFMRLAQQVRPAFTFLIVQRGIGRVEITDHAARKVGPQYCFGYLAPATVAHYVQGNDVVDEDPQPMIGAVDAPTGFIHVQRGLLAQHGKQARIGRAEQRRHFADQVAQFAFADPQPEVGRQFVADFAVAEAQGHFLIHHEQHHVQTQAMAGQGGCHRGFFVGMAVRTPTPFNGVTGDLGGPHRFNIFNDAFAGHARASQWLSAIGAMLADWNLFGPIHVRRLLAPTARMPGRTPPALAWGSVTILCLPRRFAPPRAEGRLLQGV